MRILVTGGTGFLGTSLLRRLLDAPDLPGVAGGSGGRATSLRASARSSTPAMGGLAARGVEFVAGDVADPDAARRMVEGVDAVVHCAGRSGLGGPMSLYRRANVEGTRALLEAARAAGVRRIVNVGTPSIHFDFTDTADRDEDCLPARMPDAYAASKFEAETALLRENGRGIETISLRPRFTTGRGETNILPRFVRMHREGKFKRIGDGTNLVDFTHVENLNDAFLLALAAPPEACGAPYLITNGDPVALWPFLDRLMEKVGLPPVTARVPYPVAAAAGFVVETMHALRGKEPPLSRLGAAVMARTMTFSIARARERLGYRPARTNEEMLDDFARGLAETGDHSTR